MSPRASRRSSSCKKSDKPQEFNPLVMINLLKQCQRVNVGWPDASENVWNNAEITSI
jgi:hypothetical protein